MEEDGGNPSSPIRIRKKDPHKIARQYQVELSRRAVDENVIVVLETGCGKTLISILLMSLMPPPPPPPSSSLFIFLAPTLVLVHQQARVIEEFTDFKVGVYCGDTKHLNTHSAWDKELLHHQVLVMTPQVLLRCLCHCFINMNSISLLIFDECHYAQLDSNHPYAEIMKVFYKPHLPKLPRIFGMTASPICGKGASINSLEALLHAKVYTVNDKNQLESVVVSPVVQVYHYSSNTGSSSTAYQKCMNGLEEIKRQCFTLLCRSGDNSSRLQDMKKLLQRLHNNMVFCLTSLGLWGALQACQILLNGDVSERTELIEAKTNTGDEFLQNDYLVQTASLLKSECMAGVEDGIALDLSHMKILEEPYFSQKVLRLIGILSSFRSRPGMKCIIFVNRIIVARSLSHILGQIKILSAWNCDFLVGVHSGLKRMSRKTMNHILEEFRSGKLNLLVATKVGEEGLDIQTCCLVIRFDLPETLASFIQSRGRARMPQSEYAFLVDSESEREMNLMDSFKKNEDLMNIDIKTRKSDGIVADIKEEVYSVGLTGATISTQTSVSLLYHYCSKLPRDEYFNPKPDLFYIDDTEGTICHIILPCNAPIHHIMSVPQPSIEAAKKDACLKACKELHQIGALTEYLLPEQDDLDDEHVHDLRDSDDSEDEDSSFVLQEMLVPAVLKEEPCSYVDDIYVHFNSYFIRFSPKPQDRQYKNFALFVKAPLPCEAEQMKIDLHLAYGRSVLTDLIPFGAVKFNQEEMLMARNFQQMCFKIILDRTEFMRSHVVLKENEVGESNNSNFYLLLPVIRLHNQNKICVDWTIINKCLSSPIFSPAAREKMSQSLLVKHLQLADGPAPVDMIVNSLVYVDHKSSFFFVSQILPHRNGYSQYNNSTTHVEHLREKFQIHLAHPEQPLLQAKQLFCLRNLLHDRKKGNAESVDVEEHFFELPPEVCELKIIGFSKDIGSSLSLLPSVMHRLENLLVAIELKDTLSKSFPEGASVSAERVLEAITTEKCHERFSLERLEVLGDAFLKFTVGRHLFLKHETFDEGHLTRKRSNAVQNSNLCRLAIINQLQVYIRDQEFDPSQFFALGHPCPIICTDETEKQIHTKAEANLKGGTDSRQVRCSKNHHWLSKKTIADVVEALVGAYVVDSGFKAATAFLTWIGIQAEFDVSAVCRAWTTSANFLPLVDCIDIPEIEDFLGHVFVHKGLLLQAFIHPSYNRHGGGCYQRLEFLGDAILDYLITSYLFSVYPDLKPGQLTDLRSSLVNNSSFARVAACRSFHKFIICENDNLRNAINKYVDFIQKPVSERVCPEEPPCPKALGDLVESCMGAILLDVGFDLNHVWNVMLSFLEPVTSFSNWQLSPVRELFELGNQYGWDVQFTSIKKNRSYVVEAIVDGRGFRSTISVTNRSKRMARRMASDQLTAKLKAQGYKLKTKSLAELLKSLCKMEARLIGYDELALAKVSSSALIDVGNLNSEGRSCPNQQPKNANPILPDNTCDRVISEPNFTNLRLEDCPNSTKNKRASLDAKPMNISYCQKKKNSSNCVISEPNFADSGLEDCTNGLKNLRFNTNTEASSSISGIHKKIPRAGSSIFKIREQDALCKTTAKSRLHEICSANCWSKPLYECCKEEGPSHLKMFTYKVVIVIEEAGVLVECFGRPEAKKKVAAEEAAEGALWFLQKEGYIHTP